MPSRTESDILRDATSAHGAMDVPAGQTSTILAGTAAIAEALEEPQAKMPVRHLLPIFIATFTLFVAYIAPTSFSLAVRVGQIDPAGRDAALALVIGLPGLLVLFFNPLVGILSDRTRWRLGRRRSWMLIGSLVSVAGSLVVGSAQSVPPILLGWSVAFVGYSVASAMITAHFGDRLPHAQRGKVMGINGAITNIAPILGYTLAAGFVSAPVALFLVPAIIAFVGALVFVVFARDPQFTGEVRKFDARTFFGGFYFNPRTYPNLGWVWLSRALVFVGLSFMSLYNVYLLGSRLGLDEATIGALAATLGIPMVLCGIVGAVGSGLLSDKLKSRKSFLVVSALLLAGGLVLIATMDGLIQYIVGTLLASLAVGAYGAVDQAIALDVIPHQENQNGRYLAIFGLGSALPQALAPFLAAGIVTAAAGAYGAVYFVGAAFAILGAFAVLPIKLQRTPGSRTPLAQQASQTRSLERSSAQDSGDNE